jgi:hypothetical protein
MGYATRIHSLQRMPAPFVSPQCQGRLEALVVEARHGVLAVAADYDRL